MSSTNGRKRRKRRRRRRVTDDTDWRRSLNSGDLKMINKTNVYQVGSININMTHPDHTHSTTDHTHPIPITILGAY